MNYIFSDLDNTLLFESKISQRDLDAIAKWKAAGNKFVIATGRGVNMMHLIFDNYPGLADYYILNNGAVILDRDKNVIKQELMSLVVARDLIKELDNEKFLVAVDTDKELYSIGEFKDDICPEVGDYAIETTKEDILKKDMNVIFLNCAPRDGSIEEAKRLHRFINEKYRKTTSIFRNKHWIDVIGLGISKGRAIRTLKNSERISKDKITVIGDSLNDISMLKDYKNSYTFADSENIVKSFSNNVVTNFHEMVEERLG